MPFLIATVISPTNQICVMDISLKRLRTQKEPFSRQLQAASDLVQLSQQSQGVASTAPVLTASVKIQLLRWIEKLAKSPTIQQEGTAKSKYAVTFWSIVEFLLEGSSFSDTHVVAVSPFLAGALCNMILHALSTTAGGSDASHKLLSTLTNVLRLAFPSSSSGSTRIASAVFPLTPEKSIRFMSQVIQKIMPMVEKSKTSETSDSVKEILLKTVLHSLVPALDNFSNDKKKFKLVVEELLIKLLSLHHLASTTDSAWGQTCVNLIQMIFQRSLFAPTVLETFDSAMPDHTKSSKSSTSSTSSKSSLSEQRPTKKRRTNTAQEAKFASFHRVLFDMMLSTAASATLNQFWMLSLPMLLQVFIDAYVERMFDSVARSVSSEHDRTRAVQRVGFKFFRELYSSILLSSNTHHMAVRLNALAHMIELICQRNIFVQSSHGLGVEHRAVMEEILKQIQTLMISSSSASISTKKKTNKKSKNKNKEISIMDNEMACNSWIHMVSLCIQMDHTFWKQFMLPWNSMLHELAAQEQREQKEKKSPTSSTLSMKCVDVFVSSVQRFAKVRQLDVYMELLCQVLQTSSSARLWCVKPVQEAIQEAVVQCPAGQIEVLWNIIHKELETRCVLTQLYPPNFNLEYLI